MALEAVQAQAGHRSIESTRIYLHLANDWLAGEYRRAAERDRRRPARELLAMQEDRPMGATRRRRDETWSRDQVAITWAESPPGPAWRRRWRRYLVQLATFLAPRSVEVADNTLRQLAAGSPTPPTSPPSPTSPRRHRGLQDLARRPARQQGTDAVGEHPTQRLGMLRVFFERIIEWDWPDAPARNPIMDVTPTTTRTAPQVPRRPDAAKLHGRRPRLRSPRPARGRAARPHRDARRRALRPRRRRRRAHR